MKLSIIVALSTNYVIGKDGKLPWHIPRDLAHFTNLTMGKPVIMGRKTYESIGQRLPGRDNIILSRNPTLKIKDCTVMPDLFTALGKVVSTPDTPEVMIIGGGQIYKQALPHADNIYLTWVHEVIDGDCSFPFIDHLEWYEADRIDSIDHGRQVSYLTLKRR